MNVNGGKRETQCLSFKIGQSWPLLVYFVLCNKNFTEKL